MFGTDVMFATESIEETVVWTEQGLTRDEERRFPFNSGNCPVSSGLESKFWTKNFLNHKL